MCWRCDEKQREKEYKRDLLMGKFIIAVTILLQLIVLIGLPTAIWYERHTSYINGKKYAEHILKTCGDKGKIIAINDGLTSGKYAKHYYETIMELPGEYRVSVDTNGIFPKIGEEYKIVFSERWSSPYLKITSKIQYDKNSQSQNR